MNYGRGVGGGGVKREEKAAEVTRLAVLWSLDCSDRILS